MRRRLLLPAVFLALHFAAGADASTPTSPTLRLTDLFTVSPGRDPWRGGQLSIDPGRAVVLVPDTDAWRMPPPTPTPTPEPQWTPPPGVDLPRYILMPNTERSLQASFRLPALQFQGLEFTRSHPGEAHVSITTTFSQLRVEYRLVPQGREEEALIFSHAPRSIDRFRVPGGTWHLEWRAWRREQPLHEVKRVYPAQPLVSNGVYTFETPSQEETTLLLELRAANRE